KRRDRVDRRHPVPTAGAGSPFGWGSPAQRSSSSGKGPFGAGRIRRKVSIFNQRRATASPTATNGLSGPYWVRCARRDAQRRGKKRSTGTAVVTTSSGV